MARQSFDPDFTIIWLQQLEHILNYSGQIDQQHYSKQKSGDALLKAKAFAPSKKRQNFGFLVDKVDANLLIKPYVQAMLTDRADLNCVPINNKEDLKPYGRLNMQFII